MSPFQTELTVRPEWIDYNGHMNVAYYVLAFDLATDSLYTAWDIGEAYIQRTGCSVFTLGMDVDYLSEVFPGDPIRVTTQLLDWDHKRLHYYHQMVHGVTGRPVANNECLAMNVNVESRRSAAFPQPTQTALAEIMHEHARLERPAGSMQRLGIRRKQTK